MRDPRGYRSATQAVRGGQKRGPHGEASEPIFTTSAFVYDSPESAEARFAGDEPGFMYSRYGNPTVRAFEERLALLEHADECRATASGMAAVSASMLSWLAAGDHVVASRALFGSCRYILEWVLPRFGIETTLINGADLDRWKASIRPNTVAFFFESPSNPLLELVDIAAVAEIARDAQRTNRSKQAIRVLVDNVFATPLLQRPLELGADVVVYSATKHIDGQGRVLGGALLGSKSFIEEELQPYLRNTGPSLSPFNAWVLHKALETIHLRVGHQCDSAEGISHWMSEQAEVNRVLYPHHSSHPQYDLAQRQMARGSTIVSFELDGGRDAAFEFQRALRLIDISNNLGDSRSIVTHPATTTHSKLSVDARAELGICEGLVRLSVGLEDVSDLKEDLSRGLAAVSGMVEVR